eukprot:1054236-Rhodomonas_salina.2
MLSIIEENARDVAPVRRPPRLKSNESTEGTCDLFSSRWALPCPPHGFLCPWLNQVLARLTQTVEVSMHENRTRHPLRPPSSQG